MYLGQINNNGEQIELFVVDDDRATNVCGSSILPDHVPVIQSKYTRLPKAT